MLYYCIFMTILSIVFGGLFVLSFKRTNSYVDLFYVLENVTFDAINYFDKLLTTPLYYNCSEIIEANEKMKSIRGQLMQFAKDNGGEVIVELPNSREV